MFPIGDMFEDQLPRPTRLLPCGDCPSLTSEEVVRDPGAHLRSTSLNALHSVLRAMGADDSLASICDEIDRIRRGLASIATREPLTEAGKAREPVPGPTYIDAVLWIRRLIENVQEPIGGGIRVSIEPWLGVLTAPLTFAAFLTELARTAREATTRFELELRVDQDHDHIVVTLTDHGGDAVAALLTSPNPPCDTLPRWVQMTQKLGGMIKARHDESGVDTLTLVYAVDPQEEAMASDEAPRPTRPLAHIIGDLYSGEEAA